MPKVIIRRIPYGSSHCLNNLVKTKDFMFARPGIDPMVIRVAFPVFASDLNIVFRTLTGGMASTGLTSAETTFFKNAEPLLVNKVHTTNLMPRSFTAVKNLFLASDYVRTNTSLATMEAANESARRATNDIIDASCTGKPYAKVWKLREWNMVLPLKWWDKKRFRKELPYSVNYPWWLRILAFI